MIGSILLPAPATTPLLSHRLSLWSCHSRPVPLCSLSKQGERFLSTLIATNSDDHSATSRLLRKFVASSSKHVALSTLSHLLSPTTTSPHRLCSLALPVRLFVIMFFSLSHCGLRSRMFICSFVFQLFPRTTANCLFPAIILCVSICHTIIYSVRDKSD